MQTASTFNIRDYGAVGDGRAKDTRAIQQAIDACADAGGGVVYCPPGEYLSGTLCLKSNVNLHLAAGAVIQGSTDRSDYDPKYLVVARDARRVAITGQGTISGSGRFFFVAIPPIAPCDRHMGVRDWRPFHMVAFLRCQDILLREVHLADSSCYGLYLQACEHATIEGIDVRSDRWGPNTDGICVDCCRHVHISGCTVDVGDDAISVKSDTSQAGAGRACEDLTVTNCTLVTNSSGVRIGFEGDGPIRGCVFSNLVIHNPDMGMGINMVVPRYVDSSGPYSPRIEHGPAIEDISFTHIVMDVKLPVFLWITDAAAPPGCIRNISISDVVAHAEQGCYLRGSPTIPIEGVSINNMTLSLNGEMDDALAGPDPQPHFFWGNWKTKGIPHGFYCGHVRDVGFRNVRVTWGQIKGAWRSAWRVADAESVEWDGVRLRQAERSSDCAGVHLSDVRGAFLHGCLAEEGTGTFLRLDGATSAGVSMIGCDLTRCLAPVSLGPEARPDVLKEISNALPAQGG